MRFRFPVIIIDEDFRSENASGLSIRTVAKAIEDEGWEVLGVTSFGDLSSFAQQQSRASAFILSIDDEEFSSPELADKSVADLRAFVEEIRWRNADIPIFLYGETRTSRHIPNDVLRELHGFIHMFEDTPEFVARYIVREARAYLDSLAPPFFRALTHYAQDGSYSWHCPGHSGGVAFLKSPVGQMFHQFFGENMLRADVCNSVDELGQLLDHTGPVAASERNAARIFGCDHLFFVTNGTSTSNKIVWHSTVAPGDVVVVDRNCHKSVLHAIIMTGAVPVFLMPTRNHFGIIGPIPLDEFKPENIERKIRANPLAHGTTGQPRILTITQSTYDGVVYNVETIKSMLDGYIDTLHFDEAWLPHAAFYGFYAGMHAIGRERPPCKESMVFSTQSTHKLLAGLSQASQILVQDSREAAPRPRRLQRGVPHAHVHQPAVRDHRVVRRGGGDDGAARRHRAGGGVDPGGPRFPARHAQGGRGVRRGLVVQGVGTGAPRRGGHRRARGLDAARGRALARLRRPRARLQHARSDQGHRDQPGPRCRRRLCRDRHPGGDRHQVSRRARHHRREDRALLVFHHVHHRHHQGPLEHAGDRAAAVQGRLRPEPAPVARAAGVHRGPSRLREDRASRTCATRFTGSTGRTTSPGSPPRCTCPTWSRR